MNFFHKVELKVTSGRRQVQKSPKHVRFRALSLSHFIKHSMKKIGSKRLQNIN